LSSVAAVAADWSHWARKIPKRVSEESKRILLFGVTQFAEDCFRIAFIAE
jgi:hypothetical protein